MSRGKLPAKPIDEGLDALLRVLDPSDNATGGGTASAVAGAMAASLVAMVARLSVGRKGMEKEEFYCPILDEAQRLALELMEGAGLDARAFDQLMAAYRMPRQTDEQRNARHRAIQRAMEAAARVPLENARRCARALDLCEKLEGRFNPNASSDWKCARYLAQAALMGCLENVCMNLPQLQRTELAQQMLEEAQALCRMSSDAQFPSEKKG